MLGRMAPFPFPLSAQKCLFFHSGWTVTMRVGWRRVNCRRAFLPIACCQQYLFLIIHNKFDIQTLSKQYTWAEKQHFIRSNFFVISVVLLFLSGQFVFLASDITKCRSYQQMHRYSSHCDDWAGNSCPLNLQVSQDVKNTCFIPALRSKAGE